MQKISVVITTFNSAKLIAACLESVLWADEIIVVDSFSTDETIDICQRYPVIFHQRAYTIPAAQKNWAIEQTKNQWVMLLDSDEQVTLELQNEILAALNQPGELDHAYRMPRKNIVFGVPMRFTGYAPDYQIRLFLRPFGTFGDRLVHEHLQVDGTIGTLKYPLLHQTHRTVSQTIESLILRWAPLEAQQRDRDGYKYSVPQHFLRTLGAFFLRFFVLQGFRDGFRGFFVAGLWAFYLFVTYAYLWELQSKQESDSFVEHQSVPQR